jgi:hypothetical protein
VGSWLIEDDVEAGWYVESELSGVPLWTSELELAARWEDATVAARAAQQICALGQPCSVVREREPLDAAPSDSDRPGPRGEATKAGAPSGVAALAGAGGPGMLPDEGAAERLAPPPQPGEEESSEAHSRPGPEVCSSGPTLPGPLCEICGRVLPPRSVRYCDGRCRGEAVRRRRFLASRKAVSP